MPDRFNITGHMGWGSLTCRGGEGERSALGSLAENGVQVTAKGARDGRELHLAVHAEDYTAILYLNPHGELVAMTRGSNDSEAWDAMNALRHAA